jgi:hypothetical protein
VSSVDEVGEVDDLFGFRVTEADFGDGAVAAASKDVDVVAILRESRPTEETGAELGPFLSLKIEDEKFKCGRGIRSGR